MKLNAIKIACIAKARAEEFVALESKAISKLSQNTQLRHAYTQGFAACLDELSKLKAQASDKIVPRQQAMAVGEEAHT